MSKDLTPLEALENIKREAGIPYFSTLYDIDMWREDFKTVETALKDIDFLKTLNENQKHNIEMLIEENREMKKSLKALVIIKKKKVNVDYFLSLVKNDTDYKEYKRLYNLYIITILSEKLLTQEEYDLLKEILK